MEQVTSYPRLLRRIRALLIDSMLSFFVVVTWWFSLPYLANFPAIVKFIYPVLAWFILDPINVSRTGGTPGHNYMGLRIQHLDSNDNIGILRAILRSIFKILTGSWSFIFVLMTRKHQALHDIFIRSRVTLRDPQAHNTSESVSERIEDVENYSYPSVWRKCLAILAYLLASFVVLSLIAGFLISTNCLNWNKCNAVESISFIVLNIGSFICIAVVMIYGWRSRLFGARRKIISK